MLKVIKNAAGVIRELLIVTGFGLLLLLIVGIVGTVGVYLWRSGTLRFLGAS